MKYACFFYLVLFISSTLKAQDDSQAGDTSWKKIYRATATKINDLVHTKLDVKFDYEKSYMYGKEWVTLKPHFYPTDSLSLDAKSMDIHQVAIVKGNTTAALRYDYDGLVLRIHLDRSYHHDQPYTIFIDYTSKPKEIKGKGSSEINDAKGLYFINPTGAIKDKPIQIWTQGETESNSAWFPTIDKPNQKTTEEILMTVPDRYVTLSNGLLISQKKHGDGTRTDDWRMDLPHAPYLFFMGVGDYAIVRDAYKGKEVAYYVEKEYAPVARRIFGLTPEMMAYFSRITGLDFPWPKYDQIVGRDYVSGAMENTTATLHYDKAQQDARELTEGNSWESGIAHELFHQWFGDLVTTESWSNITLNESFADYGETLWEEYKYGKDAGEATNYFGMQSYLRDPSASASNLVRFYYADKEDVFDNVSYAKGGRILNMLRNYVGDSAFFKSLNLYLTRNKFKSAEAQDLKLAFEEVTGQDLNWFWNQWYYGSGHPMLDIQYSYEEPTKTVQVIVRQTNDKIFRLPMAIDVYTSPSPERHSVWINKRIDTFQFAAPRAPFLVNADGDKVLLCTKKENKSLENYLYQYQYAGRFVDRWEAMQYCIKHQKDSAALALLKIATKDPHYRIRLETLGGFDLKDSHVKTEVEPLLVSVIKNDNSKKVRAKAIELLGSYRNPAYASIFAEAALDSSYTVSANALEALSAVDSVQALTIARSLSSKPAKGKLEAAIAAILIQSGDDSKMAALMAHFEKMGVSQEAFQFLPAYANLLKRVKDTVQFKKAIDQITGFRDAIPASVRKQTDPFINNSILKGIADSKEAQGFHEQAAYVLSKIAENKKSF